MQGNHLQQDGQYAPNFWQVALQIAGGKPIHIAADLLINLLLRTQEFPVEAEQLRRAARLRGQIVCPGDLLLPEVCHRLFTDFTPSALAANSSQKEMATRSVRDFGHVAVTSRPHWLFGRDRIRT